MAATCAEAGCGTGGRTGGERWPPAILPLGGCAGVDEPRPAASPV